MTSRTTYDVVCDVCSKETQDLMFDDDETDYSSTWINVGYYTYLGDGKTSHKNADICSDECLSKFITTGILKGRLTREQADNRTEYGQMSRMRASSSLPTQA